MERQQILDILQKEISSSNDEGATARIVCENEGTFITSKSRDEYMRKMGEVTGIRRALLALMEVR